MNTKSLEEKIIDIMNYSKYGALSQMFVAAALDKYTQLVIEDTTAWPEDYFLNQESWKAVAKEIREKLK